MLNAGLLEITVVDDWKAKMWAQVCRRSRCAAIWCCATRYTGWAVRKGSPKLAETDDFYPELGVKKRASGLPARQLHEADQTD